MLNLKILDHFEIVTLKSGVKSLRSLGAGETFHPGIGPLIEANTLHVEQQNILARSAALQKFIVWDVGFGAGANVLALVEALSARETADNNLGADRKAPGLCPSIEIHSFDKSTDPIEFALAHAEELGYVLGHEAKLQEIVANKFMQLSPSIAWHFHFGNFVEQMTSTTLPAPHSIFYDPYSPVQNPEMWSLDHFTTLYSRLDPETVCLLTNYTRSTAVRVSLLLAGFSVGIGCIVGEKAETSIASNHLAALERPLDRKWLERVRVSHNAAPLRSTAYSVNPISEADFAQLARCPQFL